MPKSILASKFFIPNPRHKLVLRPHLIKRLNNGLFQNKVFGRKLSLISAPAGFGKTTLLSEWFVARDQFGETIHIDWLSLDKEDNDPVRLLLCIISTLQRVVPNIAVGTLEALQSPPAAKNRDSPDISSQ